MTQARSLPLVALALAVTVVIAHARVIAGGKTWDDVRYHTEIAPPRIAAAESVLDRRLPAWWDGSGFGVPLLAEPTHGALYPPHWIAASPRALDLVLLLHLAWAALGVAVWARRRTPPVSTGVSDHSALVAGILVATTGVLASAAVRGALPALSHLPWIGAAAAWLSAATETRERANAAVALGGLVALVALTGTFGVLVDTVLVALIVGARRRTLRWIGPAIAGGLLLGAVQWIPALLHAGDAAGGTVRGLGLARIVELIVPGSFGSSDPARAVSALAGEGAQFPSLYVGASLLALAAVVPPSRRVIALILALGLFALVAGRGGWPAWSGAPEIHVAALAMILGARAGAGVDALLRGDRRAMLALVVAVGCSAIVLGALGALRAKHPESAPAIDRALLDGGLGLVCLGGAIVLVRKRPGRALPLLFAMLVLPSIGAMPSMSPVVARDTLTTRPAFAEAIETFASEIGTDTRVEPVRVFRPAFMHDAPIGLDEAVATLAGDAGWRWRLASARSESPARLAPHDKTWLAAAREGGAFLDRFGVALAILPETMVTSPTRGLTAIARRGDWALVVLPVAPIASVMRGWRWTRDPADALALMFAPGGGTNIGRGTVVLFGASTDRRGRPAPSPPSPCSVTAWTAGEIQLACAAESDGYAVVTSSAMAGWTASVDGVETPWEVADVIRRAVPVARGTHAIAWSYTPPGVIAGLVLAAFGALVLAFVKLAGDRAPRAED